VKINSIDIKIVFFFSSSCSIYHLLSFPVSVCLSHRPLGQSASLCVCWLYRKPEPRQSLHHPPPPPNHLQKWFDQTLPYTQCMQSAVHKKLVRLLALIHMKKWFSCFMTILQCKFVPDRCVPEPKVLHDASLGQCVPVRSGFSRTLISQKCELRTFTSFVIAAKGFYAE
jgi:hypothetical protein